MMTGPVSASGRADAPDAVARFLRECVHCGLCLATCATYLATGDETLSPRGRLQLLADLAARDLDPAAMDPVTRRSLALCLGCRACETTCPSGVPFSLFERAKALAETPDPLPLWLVRPERLGWWRWLGNAGETLLRHLGGARWRDLLAAVPGPPRRLARLLGSRPVVPEDPALVRLLDARSGLRTPLPAGLPRADPARGTVALFPGCADTGLLPAAGHRLTRLLAACGYQVVTPTSAGCCGALDAHGGRPRAAARYRERQLPVLSAAVSGGVPLVVQAAGCALELSRYPPPVGTAVTDAVALLARSPLPPRRRVPLKVAIHDPCHARHGRGIVAEPRAVLASLPGVTLVEPEEPEVCCGSGGPYALLHPGFSAAMGRRKAHLLAATGADVVVTTNPGCLGQLRDALAREAPLVPVLLLSDLVWYACLMGPEVARSGGSAEAEPGKDG